MKYLKDNLTNLLVIFLLVYIVFFNKGQQPVNDKPIIVNIVDTTWKGVSSGPVLVYPKITNTIPYKVNDKDTAYIPDTNYAALKKQFEELRDDFLSVRIYDDTIKQDSSKISIRDSVFKNRLLGRNYQFDLKYPVITNTTIIKEPYKPRNQLYGGFGINGDQASLVRGGHLGLGFKSKKDRLTTVNVGLNTRAQVYANLTTYWKF